MSTLTGDLFAALQGRLDAALARAEKAERERDEARHAANQNRAAYAMAYERLGSATAPAPEPERLCLGCGGLGYELLGPDDFVGHDCGLCSGTGRAPGMTDLMVTPESIATLPAPAPCNCPYDDCPHALAGEAK